MAAKKLTTIEKKNAALSGAASALEAAGFRDIVVLCSGDMTHQTASAKIERGNTFGKLGLAHEYIRELQRRIDRS